MNGMLGIAVDRNGNISLARQIREQIARLILGSHLRAGDMLPSTRELAKSLDVSRNTVNEAYEMLWAEGYIASRHGSGFRVLENIALKNVDNHARSTPVAPEPMAIRYDFRTGIPDLDRFPFSAWNKIQREVLETIKPRDMLYGNTQGYAPLRKAIANWLLRFRGMRADSESIFITSGATQAIGLAVETLFKDEHAFLVENPSHLGITRLMRLKNIPFLLHNVDERGMAVEKGRLERLSGVYVTPSHQFPLGCVLSALRRTQLIAAAREKDFYIIEDDYDSEYRYGGQTLTPLYAHDPARVIYVGSFSKTLFPALRIGFAVVPAALQDAWTELRRYSDVQNAIVEQVVLCRFLEQRRMDRHIKSMTRIYGRKRDRVIGAIAHEFGGNAEILGDSAGLHLALRVPGRRLGREFKEQCRERGMALMPCSRYELKGTEYNDTLLIGYGNVDENRILEGLQLLSEIMKSRFND